MQKSAEFTGNIESQLKELQEKVGENSQQIVSHSSKIKELDSNVGDEFMVVLQIFRKRCTGLKKKPKTCSISPRQ
jgi:Fe-S-cluster containining protein